MKIKPFIISRQTNSDADEKGLLNLKILTIKKLKTTRNMVNANAIKNKKNNERGNGTSVY